MTIKLSNVSVSTATGLRRHSPRPAELRDASYEADYDWTTLFFDVYRVDKHIVFQGPPLFDWWKLLQRSAVLRNHAPLFGAQGDYVERPLCGEIWLEAPWKYLSVTSALGDFGIPVQPNESDLFTDRRVLVTISKDNEKAWIEDWIAFHRHLHGADAVLLYDNNSSLYSAAGLEAHLRQRFPDMVVSVVSWPFLFGPKGGTGQGEDGREAPWDSDFTQAGALQHARFRFLRNARSVLNCDIDELVIGEGDVSVFAETEGSDAGMLLFEGRWINNYVEDRPGDNLRRHADYLYAEEGDAICPAKWCVCPSKLDDRVHSWANHRVLGSGKLHWDHRFSFRHFKAISTDWKYRRWKPEDAEKPNGLRDEVLAAAFARVKAAEEQVLSATD